MEERRANTFKWWLSGVTLLLPLVTGMILYWIRSEESARLMLGERVNSLEEVQQIYRERVAILETKNVSYEARFVEISNTLRRIEDKVDQVKEKVR